MVLQAAPGMSNPEINELYAKFLEKEMEKAQNPARGLRVFNMSLASTLTFYAFYHIFATIGDSTISAFTIPADILAMLYGSFNLTYHYKLKGINISLGLLIFLSIIFFIGHISLLLSNFFIFETDYYYSPFRYYSTTSGFYIFTLIFRLFLAFSAFLTFILLRRRDKTLSDMNQGNVHQYN
jgi:hypothetical protein